MAKQDFRINEYGVNVADLKEGQWVELSWEDAPNCVALIYQMESRLPSFQGERDIKILIQGPAFSALNQDWVQHWATNSQVVRIIGMIEAPKL